MLRSNTQNAKSFFSDRLLLFFCLVAILIASKVCFAQEPGLAKFFGPGSRPNTPISQNPQDSVDQQRTYQPAQQASQNQFAPSQVRSMGGYDSTYPQQGNPIVQASTNESHPHEVAFQDDVGNLPPLVSEITAPEEENASKADVLLKKKIKNGSSAIDAQSLETEEGEKEYGSKRLDLGPVISMGGCLAVVLGIFFIFAWMMKRATPQRGGMLPAEVFEKLGSVPYTSKMQLHLFRLGGKLILASVTSDSMEAVAEITNPDEVIHLVSLCKQNDPKSSSAAFRQVLKQYTGEQGPSTFYPNVGTTTAPMQQHTTAHPAQTQMKQRPIGMVSPAKAYQR